MLGCILVVVTMHAVQPLLPISSQLVPVRTCLCSPQIPSDCDAVEEAVEGERALRARQLCPPPSSFAEDAAAVLGPPAPGSPVSPWSNSSGGAPTPRLHGFPGVPLTPGSLPLMLGYLSHSSRFSQGRW